MKTPLALALALVLSLGQPACQRQAPLAGVPARAEAPGKLQKSSRPIEPRRVRGMESFGGSLLLAVEPGIAGDRVSALLEIPKQDCAVVIARGSSSVEDLDLLAYGEDGAPLGSDEAPDREPSLLICPPHPGRVFVAARIAQGHGLVALGSERVPPGKAQAAAQRYHVKPHAPGDLRIKAWPNLDELVLRERARVGGRFQDVRRVALALDSSVATTLPASIEAGRCVHALFVPSDEVSHLDVAALDARGRVLGRALASGRQRALVICSSVASDIAFEIRPHVGRGLAVAVLSRSVPGSEPELEGEIIRHDVYPTGDAKKQLASLQARLEPLGYGPVRATRQLDLAVGRRSALPLALAGGCTRIDVVGSSPLRGLSARLWSENGQLWAEGEAGSFVTLFACGAGKPRLDVSATLAAGPASVTLQREPDVPAELVRRPLAASRLIERMWARGVLKRADAIGKVSELSLGSETLTRLPFMVPLDRCLDIDVGIEGGAAGVELRALDADSLLELDATQGQQAASTRICAYQRGSLGSLNVQVELRSLGGSAQALLATRLLAPAE